VMGMVIYADILVAVNYYVSYLLLCGAEHISGIPLSRRRKVLAALVGGLCAMAVFLPLRGFVCGLALRVVTSAAMLCTAWPGRYIKDYLRLGIILLVTSFLFAGGVMALCLLWPALPLACPGGMIYFDISPLLLLLTVTGCYLLLGLLKRFYSCTRTRQLVYPMTLGYGGKEITLRMLKDSGNRLVEPFSGLPVAVCSLPVLAPLLSAEECDAVRFPARGDSLPSGFRLVSYQAVGGGGLLAAFRPEKLCLHSGGQIYDCLAWVAVQEGAMADCDGVFNPDMLELRI